MKKVHFLLLLITSFVIAQPVINTPSDFTTCADYYSNGITTFDLTTKNAEILASNSSALYSVNYFESLTNATVNVNSIPTPSNYTNISPNNQTVYARVTEIANTSNFATTTLNLVVIARPFAVNPGNYAIHDVPFDGFATFDLTTKTAGIISGQANCTVNYFENYTDALNNTNPIVNPVAYTNTTNTQQGIGFRITNNITGCYTVSGLILFVINEPIITFSDQELKQTLVGSNIGNTYPIAYDLNSQPMTLDANGDSEIEQSEAAAVHILNLTYHDPNNLGYRGNIHNLNGLGAFTNLIWIVCGQQSLDTIDTVELANIPTLQLLSVSYNNLSSLDVSMLPNLSTLYCSANQISNLNVTGLTNLSQLFCNYNSLSSLNLTGLSSLTQLECSGNQITNLNVAPLTPLTYLHCGYNLLTSLNITPLVNLTDFDCSSNAITTLDVAPLVNLTTLSCRTNQISTLDVASLVNMTSLTCGNNLLTTINAGGLTQLTTFSIPNCPITVLPITSLVNLTTFDCTNDLMTTLDVSTQVNLTTLYCGGPNLTTLFMKNGKNETLSIPSTSTNLQFICADEGQVATIQTIASSNASPTVVVSSYCSFTPGGNYNKVTGLIRLDNDNNGCDVNDTIVPDNVRLNFTDGTVSSATFINSSATYTLFGGIGSYVLTPSLENPAYFGISPTSVAVDYTVLNNTVTNQDFCMTPTGVHNDLEVIIAPITPARPGFDAVYQVVYKNKGNQTLSGNVTFSYDDSVLNFVSSTVATTSQSTGLLTYDYTNLLPFENRSFYITLNVNTPTDTPAVTIGDHLSFIASVNPILGDENTNDNTFVYNQTVVGSFDPNDITCIEGNVLPPSEIGNYLHYVINFENTGTADAENIVVKDIIDTTQFDVNSLQILNSSTSVTARLTGNVAEFIFQNINLHSGGHGNILIKIKSNDTLVQGNTVSKKATIFFDYNAPVNTNLENTIFQSLNTPGFEKDNSISIYPNPSKENVNIKSNNTIKSVQLYDIQGRLLQTNLVDETNTTINIKDKSNGVYFIKVLTDKGIGVEKIIKE